MCVLQQVGLNTIARVGWMGGGLVLISDWLLLTLDDSHTAHSCFRHSAGLSIDQALPLVNRHLFSFSALLRGIVR